MENERKIRSFVLRKGRITAREQHGLDTCWAKHGVVVEEGVRLNFRQLFDNDKPVVLDIGFGMGAALVEMAQRDQSRNYIGVEVFLRGIGSVLSSIEELGLSNLKVINHDALELLINHISAESISKCCVFFPDPWHKHKHKKRRLINYEFIDILSGRMSNEGILHIATDWDDYAAQCVRILQQHSAYEVLDCSQGNSISPRLMTKYEARGLALGHDIHDIFCRKISQ